MTIHPQDFSAFDNLLKLFLAVLRNSVTLSFTFIHECLETNFKKPETPPLRNTKQYQILNNTINKLFYKLS